MKKILIILFWLISVSLNATTYYVASTGSDVSGKGTLARPWATLYHACDTVVVVGDIIHIKAGTITETTQSILAVGVSIEGEGVTSVIHSHFIPGGGDDYDSFTICLQGVAEGENGNQSISNIKMDGDALTAYGAIRIYRRSNVHIYNCTFIDFLNYGVSFVGGTYQGSEPTTYAIGNKFHDNIVNNCSGYFPHGDPEGEGKGLVQICGQDGLLIYNNILTQDSRAVGYNGYCIKAVSGYLKNLKIYNNIITKNIYDGLTWDFAIELWNIKGGVEIYNNTITAAVDIGGPITSKGTETYSVYIYNNTIGQYVLGSSDYTTGLFIEQSVSDAIIEKNYIRNVCRGIFFPLEGASIAMSNIRINNNIFSNIGVNDSGSDYKGWGLIWTQNNNTQTVTNMDIWNNTFSGHSGINKNMWAIQLPSRGTVSDISIRNNIVKDFYYAAVFATNAGTLTIDILSIEKNILYNNGNSNDPLYTGVTPTNVIDDGGIKSNPLFKNYSYGYKYAIDFDLQNTSPAIGAGIDLSLSSDYFGHKLKHNPPDIGAIEYKNYRGYK